MNLFKRNKNVAETIVKPKFIELYDDEFHLTGTINFRVWTSIDYFTLVFRNSSKPAKDDKRWDWIFTKSFKKEDVHSGSLKELALKTYDSFIESKIKSKKIESWLESEIIKLKESK